MEFHYYSPSHFEKWDFRNPTGKGIGGSETAHIETCLRLAKRGHKVYSYSPLPKDTPKLWGDVYWCDLKEADFSKEGVWLMGRDVVDADRFSENHPKQKVFLVMQDTVYPYLTKKRALKFDKFLALCTTHVTVTENEHPEVKDRVVLSANGIRTDIIDKLEPEKRDPYRMMYASSPDRGLITLLKIFPSILAKEPRANLHIFYGLDNIMKFADQQSPIDALGTTPEELLSFSDQPNVFWHGRIGQIELYKEWLKTGVWAYPTRFSETSCITSMEAQALGAIPVTNPFWALKDNVMYGSLIDGDPGLDGMTRTRYIEEILYWMNYNFLPPVKDGYIAYRKHDQFYREDMMKKARDRFDWEKVVDQYEQLAKL